MLSMWYINILLTTSPFVSILNFSTYVKDFKQFISGLTFTRGSNQPFISNVIVFLSERLSIKCFFLTSCFSSDCEPMHITLHVHHWNKTKKIWWKGEKTDVWQSFFPTIGYEHNMKLLEQKYIFLLTKK
jgi:hypothetical protein